MTFYNNAIARIEGKAEEHKNLALRTLHWISTALRPLRIHEPRHGLAVEPGDSALDGESMARESLVTSASVTARLVSVDVESETDNTLCPLRRCGVFYEQRVDVVPCRRDRNGADLYHLPLLLRHIPNRVLSSG